MAAVDEIEQAGGQAIAVASDVSREEDARRLIAETIAKFGSLDCLVNNAGDSGPTAPVQDYPLDDWHYTINSCLTSAYLCARFSVPAMIAARRGKHNITVNAIAPGAVEGDRIDRVIASQAEVRGASVEQLRKAFVARAPLGRMTTPEDIAWLAAFLCSDHARNISGQCIPVNAGEPS
jgi:NAD(P)-dependent dehydrogenase (short-subunit alcohol dehydrogenase family)